VNSVPQGKIEKEPIWREKALKFIRIRAVVLGLNNYQRTFCIMGLRLNKYSELNLF